MRIKISTSVVSTNSSGEIVDELDVIREVALDEDDLASIREHIQRTANAAKAQFDDEVAD